MEFLKRFEEKVASLDVAGAWDNVGLLFESARMSCEKLEDLKVRVCIDLTSQVVKEAIDHGEELIVAYHPQLFRGAQSLTLTSHQALLECASNHISVFSPHTSIDPDINDYLLDAFMPWEISRDFGRVVIFNEPKRSTEVISVIKKYLGLELVRFADSGNLIKSVAVCAGSGASVLAGVEADLYWTGEMSHHEVLDCLRGGHSVVLCEHTNTERVYLPILCEQLKKRISVKSANQSVSDKDPLVIV